MVCRFGTEKEKIDWGEEKPWQSKWNRPVPREQQQAPARSAPVLTGAQQQSKTEPILRDREIHEAQQRYIDQPHVPKCEFRAEHAIFGGSSLSGQPRFEQANPDQPSKTLPSKRDFQKRSFR